MSGEKLSHEHVARKMGVGGGPRDPDASTWMAQLTIPREPRPPQRLGLGENQAAMKCNRAVADENWLREVHVVGKMRSFQEPAWVLRPCRDFQPPPPGKALPDGPDVSILECHTRQPRLLANHALPLQWTAKKKLIQELADGIDPALAAIDSIHRLLKGCGAH